jgi:hypothetical protein
MDLSTGLGLRCDISSPASRFHVAIPVSRDADLLSPCRRYAEAKLQENLDSEIMEVLLQEAREAFDEEIVIELTSNSLEEMESNLDRIEAWVKQWKVDNA